jgi:hypothetical protein
MHQLIVSVPGPSASVPNLRLVMDTRLAHTGAGESPAALKWAAGVSSIVTGGWSRHTGISAYCGVMFSATTGNPMSRALKPYFGINATNTIWKARTGTDDAGTDFQSYLETRPTMPAGWGMNHRITDPIVVANAATGVTITVTPLSDFGLASTQTGSVLLTATGSETRVERRAEGCQTAGAGAIAFRIGDAAAFDGAWTIDALIAQVMAQEYRA